MNFEPKSLSSDHTLSVMLRTTLLLLLVHILTTSFAQTEAPRLKITPLTGDFHIYTTYNEYEGTLIPAHGMYLVIGEGVVLFDTPWDTTQFQPLLDSIKQKHNKQVALCLATHWHNDRTEGLEYYRQLGIKTYTTTLTDEWSQKNEMKRAEFLMTSDTVFRVGDYSFVTFYPGEGHTADNIVIWFEKEKILYGGCLIKGTEATDLGYLGDANVKEYANTLKRVQQKFRDPKHIIVSHHNSTDAGSLEHSIRLAEELR